MFTVKFSYVACLKMLILKCWGNTHKHMHKILGIRVYFKGFTNKSDMGCENKSKMIPSFGS